MYSMSLDDANAFVVQAIFDAQKCFVPASVPHCLSGGIVIAITHTRLRCELGNLVIGIVIYVLNRLQDVLGLDLWQFIKRNLWKSYLKVVMIMHDGG